MITRSEAVGGTEFTLYDDSGNVIATAVLGGSEVEGPFVAHLLEWLSERADAVVDRPQRRVASAGLSLL